MNKKLSDLILEGCKLAPMQFRHQFWTPDGQCACAMGAAILAVNPNCYRDETSAWEILEASLGYNTHERMLANPETNAPGLLDSTVIDLNDRHGWTREQIAAWLKDQGL